MKLPHLLVTTGHPAADAAERLTAMLLVGLIAVGGIAMSLSGRGADWTDLVKAGAGATLIAAPVCIWITNGIEDLPARSFGGTLARWVARLQDLLSPGAKAPCRLDGSGSRRTALLLAVEAMAGSDVDLSREIDLSRANMACLAALTGQLLDRAAAIASASRAAQSQMVAMREANAGLAKAACAVRTSMQQLSGTTVALTGIAGQLHQELREMEVQAGRPATASSGLALASQTIRAGNSGCLPPLDTLLAAVAELQSASWTAFSQVEQMADLALDRHRAGETLAQEIDAQSLESLALLGEVETLRPTLVSAQTSAERMGSIEAARQRGAHAVWRDVAADPRRAETVALLLKGLPDFPKTLVAAGAFSTEVPG